MVFSAAHKTVVLRRQLNRSIKPSHCIATSTTSHDGNGLSEAVHVAKMPVVKQHTMLNTGFQYLVKMSSHAAHAQSGRFEKNVDCRQYIGSIISKDQNVLTACHRHGGIGHSTAIRKHARVAAVLTSTGENSEETTGKPTMMEIDKSVRHPGASLATSRGKDPAEPSLLQLNHVSASALLIRAQSSGAR